MSRTTGWNGQRRSQVQIGFASMAALLGLGALPELAAQPATPEQPAPPTPAASAPAQSESAPTVLPRVTVSTNRPRPTPARNTPARRTTVQAPAVPAQPVTDAPSSDGEQRAGGGTTVGYVATRISTATKTETPLINVPQSVTVLTSNFIKDQNFQSFSEAIRYVPGVVPHQGEFNRDQVVLRGQSSSADFFVNGIRDDVQYFRDFYNIQRVEVLKGPNAMIFGRGGGGGIINRGSRKPTAGRSRNSRCRAARSSTGARPSTSAAPWARIWPAASMRSTRTPTAIAKSRTSSATASNR